MFWLVSEVAACLVGFGNLVGGDGGRSVGTSQVFDALASGAEWEGVISFWANKANKPTGFVGSTGAEEGICSTEFSMMNSCNEGYLACKSWFVVGADLKFSGINSNGSLMSRASCF